MTAPGPTHTPTRRSATLSVVAVWLAAVAGAALVLGFALPAERLLWLPIVLAAATILAFCLQLSLRSKGGLVDRLMASVGGAVVILGLVTVAVSLPGIG